jgi:pilus assembly protein Flp/PilA
MLAKLFHAPSRFKAALLERFHADEEGATAVEYGMLVALIAAVIVLTVQTLGGQIQAAFQTIVDAL